MINVKELINKINNLLIKYYPIKKRFNNIINLTHFKLINITDELYLPFKFSLESEILLVGSMIIKLISK